MTKLRVIFTIFAVTTACSPFGSNEQVQAPQPARGTVTVGLAGISPATLDPARSDRKNLAVVRIACDTLTSLDHESGRVEMSLAERVDLQDEATRVRVLLRRGLMFHNGKKVDAQSIIDSFNRLVQPATGSPWSSLLSPVRGFDAVQSGAATVLEGLKVVDDRTIDINLGQPSTEFPSLLSHPSLAPVWVSGGVDEAPAEGGSTLPVCAGPYRLEPAAGERDIRMARVKDHRLNSRSAKGVEPASIVIRGFDSQELAFDAFRRAEVDVVEVPQGSFAEVAPGEPGHLSQRTAEVTYLSFDVTRPPTSEVAIRRAASLAIDRLAIVDAAFGDDRQPALRWLGNRQEASATSTCSAYTRKISDPDKSKKVLADAGISAPLPSFPLVFDIGRGSRLTGQAIQVQLKDVLGLETDPQGLDGPAFDASARERPAPGAWLINADPLLPTPDRLLGALFRTGSADNLTRFSDPEFDSLIEAASRTISEKEREKLYEQAEELICDKAPAIPLWTGVRHWMYDTTRLGFNGPEMDILGELVIRNISVREKE